MTMRSNVAALVLLVVAGCATQRHTSGQMIRDDDVGRLVKGRTTMEEVIALFGEPTRAVPMGDETIYTYEYRVTKGQTMFFPYVSSGESKDEADKLAIVFDKNKVVKTYNLQRGVGK